jgi:uncharacterized glyoxalase superfamily protein PhnB
MPAKKKKAKTKPKKAATKRKPARRQPESLRVRQVAPSITVNDIARSVAWYRDILGFTVGERWEEEGRLLGVQLKAGAVDLMLGQDDFSKGRDRKKGDGIRIWFQTVQDIDALAARVKASGGVLDYEPGQTPWGGYAFAISDPDGFKLTFVQQD